MYMEGRSHRAHRPAAAMRRSRIAFVLAALIAVFLQAFVVQTHIHAAGAVYLVSFTQLSGGEHELSLDASTTGDHQAACVICQAMATAGAAMLPSAAIVAATVQANADAIIALAQAPRVHSHSWRSRAPPSFL